MSGRTTPVSAQGAGRGLLVTALLAAFALVAAAILAVAALVLSPGTAAAQTATDSYVDRAAEGLQTTSVWVHPEATGIVSEQEAGEVAAAIRQADTPIYVAVLPADALDQAGGDEQALAQQVAERLQRSGTIAVLAGDAALGAGDNQSNVDAPAALDAAVGSGAAPGADVLLAFVEEVRLQASGEAGTGTAAAFGAVTLGLLVLAGGGLAFWGVRAKKRSDERRRREFEEVEKVAYDDLDALGQDLRALDLDVSMPDADELALAHYKHGLTQYEQATSTIDRATTVEDLRPVSTALAEGRFQMACAKARLEGRPLPERRPPCFFDPRHGPSVEDVQWAPMYAPPRSVPACASDAHRVKEGLEPDTRQIMVNNQMTPYYNAPGYYGPYAGGYFGDMAGGLMAGMLIGSMLSPGWGYGFGGDMGMGEMGDGGGFDFGGGDGGGFDFGGFDF